MALSEAVGRVADVDDRRKANQDVAAIKIMALSLWTSSFLIFAAIGNYYPLISNPKFGQLGQFCSRAFVVLLSLALLAGALQVIYTFKSLPVARFRPIVLLAVILSTLHLSLVSVAYFYS